MKYKKKLFTIILIGMFMATAFAEKTKIEFSADNMTGSIINDNADTTLSGNAVVKTDDLNIKGETIKLTGKDFRYITASGKVQGENQKEEFSFQADLIKYDREQKTAEFFGNVQFSDKKNEAVLNADYAHYDENTETLILRFNVSITQKETKCNSFFATYRRKESTLDLVGKPCVEKEGDVFNAQRIIINLDTEEISLEGKVSGSVIEDVKDEKQDTETTNETSSNTEKNEPVDNTVTNEGNTEND
ncbi:MAG: lipopolysaccharide transporter LptA [Treponema sp.]|nr:MAG: lipopolysaccharide transporter LptA [Treponema sp.]